MILDKELISEKNYTGSRLILIEDEKLTELQEKLSALQQEINPIIDKLDKDYYSKIDPIYQEVQRLTKIVNEERDKIRVLTNDFKPEIDTIESTEQKATLIKNKMQPIILKAVEGKLEEFEVARHTTVKDGKIYVEVYDELEEKIKSIRASKIKK